MIKHSHSSFFLSGSAGDAVEALKIATDNFKEESIPDDSMTSSAESEEELIEALQDIERYEDNDEDKQSRINKADEKVHKKIINTGQRILYQFSNARKHTPKQISTGLFVHQASRNNSC